MTLGINHEQSTSYATRPDRLFPSPAVRSRHDASSVRRWAYTLDRPCLPTDSSTGRFVANLDPSGTNHTSLLAHPLEARLFQIFIETTSRWLDVTSPSCHFSRTVPRLALENEVLLLACLAYASKAVAPTTSLSDQYGSACIELLIPLLSDEVFVHTDNTLLATLVLLRHVEQYTNAAEDQAAHLGGAFAIIASRKVLPRHESLPGAALWTYMRQDLRRALIHRAAPKLRPRHNPRPDELDATDCAVESIWADRACHLALMACCFAWSDSGAEVDPDNLLQLLNTWRNSLPHEYNAYHEDTSALYYLSSWHGMSLKGYLLANQSLKTPTAAAWQFYHLTSILMLLYHTQPVLDTDILTLSSQVEVGNVSAHY